MVAVPKTKLVTQSTKPAVKTPQKPITKKQQIIEEPDDEDEEENAFATLRSSMTKSSGGGSGEFFKYFVNLKNSGDSVRVRFYNDLEKKGGVLKMVFHSAWADGKPLVNTPCYKHYKSLGAPACPYCNGTSDIEVDSKMFYLAPVHEYQNTSAIEGQQKAAKKNPKPGTQKIFKFKDGEKHPWKPILDYYEIHETIIANDFIVTRTGTGYKDTVYSAVADDKSARPKMAVWDKEEMKRIILLTHNADLYSQLYQEEEPEEDEQEAVEDDPELRAFLTDDEDDEE